MQNPAVPTESGIYCVTKFAQRLLISRISRWIRSQSEINHLGISYPQAGRMNSLAHSSKLLLHQFRGFMVAKGNGSRIHWIAPQHGRQLIKLRQIGDPIGSHCQRTAGLRLLDHRCHVLRRKLRDLGALGGKWLAFSLAVDGQL